MEIRNTIIIGYKKDGVKLLPWRNSNGILVAGVPGSGKTYTASWLLAQYAYNGTRLVIADYGASITVEQTLLDSLDYVSDAFIASPVSSATDIVSYIERVKALGDDRYSGKIPKDDHYPIVFAIDEFPAFIANYKPPFSQTTRLEGDIKSVRGQRKTVQAEPTFLDSLLVSILKLRKVNIHFMLIGQEWTQMGTVGMRAIRSNIGDKIIHRLDKNGSALFGFDSREQKQIIMNLQIGQTFVQDQVLWTPRMTDSTMNTIQERVSSYDRRSLPDTRNASVLTQLLEGDTDA